MMLVISRRFFKNRVADTLDLLAQDGITGCAVEVEARCWYLLSEAGHPAPHLPGLAAPTSCPGSTRGTTTTAR